MEGRTCVALGALLAGVALLPLQWTPRLPLAGLTLSDLCFVVGMFLFAVEPGMGEAARRVLSRPMRLPCAAILLFAAGATVSAVANGGDYLKLAGHWELALLCVFVAVLTCDENAARRVRQALVVAALFAAATGLVGVVLWALGLDTALLNPGSGDLVAGNYPRARGTLVRANMLATVIATGGCLLAAEPELAGRRPVTRWACWALLSVALAFSFSRTMPGLLLVVFALAARRRGWSRGVSLGYGGVILVYLALLALGSRFEVVLDPTDPLHARLDLMRPATRWVFGGAAWDAIAASPLFGLGPGFLPGTGFSAHFTILNVWMVLGVVPLGAFVYLVGRLLIPSLLGKAPGAYSALALLAVDGLHRDIEDMRHLWIVMGLLMALLEGVSRNGK